MCVTLHPLSSFSIRMQKTFLLLFLFLFPSSNVSTRTATPEKKVATSVPAPQKMDGEQLFEDMQLGGVVNFLAFRQAVAGYNLIKQKSKSILTLIDFTKPSTENVCLSLIWNRKRCYTHQWSLMEKQRRELCYLFLQRSRLL